MQVFALRHIIKPGIYEIKFRKLYGVTYFCHKNCGCYQAFEVYKKFQILDNF